MAAGLLKHALVLAPETLYYENDGLHGAAMTTNGSTPPLDAWQVESMRVTVFPSDVVPVEQSWWDDIIGVPAETVTSRSKAGQYQAEGDFEARRLRLQIQPGRIDWSVTPIIKAEDELTPVLGPLPDVLTSLSKVVSPWLSLASEMKRLAFGATLLQPVENGPAGYALIQKYLHRLHPDLDGASDFFYQINRPRPSGTQVPGLRINRLMRWSVQVAQRMALTLGGGGAVTRNLGEETACRLELDINTAPDFPGLLPAEHLTVILHEMMEFGREIAQKGDVR